MNIESTEAMENNLKGVDVEGGIADMMDNDTNDNTLSKIVQEDTASNYQSIVDAGMTQHMTDKSGTNISDCSLESGGTSLSDTAQLTVVSSAEISADNDAITPHTKCIDTSTVCDETRILRDSYTEEIENNCNQDAAAIVKLNTNAEILDSHDIGNISENGYFSTG